MSRFTEVRNSVFAVLVGGCAMYFAWESWLGLEQLEAGERESVKLWAPVAAVYGMGGAWSTIAKWGGAAFFALSGAFYVWYAGILPWCAAPAAEPATPAAQQDRADDTDYDLTIDLEVTRAQVAREEAIVLAGPNGDVRLQLDRRYRSGRLRFPGEGLLGKGDLIVMLKVRDA